jgi:hypothetical protein
MTFESPVARLVFIYWVFVVIAWWYPGFYRIRTGRRGEIGRSWRAHQEDFEDFLENDPEAEQYVHLLRTPLFLGIRVACSVGWPIAMVVYFWHFVKRRYRLTRLRRGVRRRRRR